jgi:hypothetical protein
MSKIVSRGQALEVAARVATQVRWDDLDGDSLQTKVINLMPEEFGKRFTAFLHSGCRIIIIGNLKLIPNWRFNPVEFIGGDWTTWKGSIDSDGLSGEEDVDLRSLNLIEIELAKFLFETCLKAGEKSITGEEKLRRLKEKPEFIRFGSNEFYALWLDYQANKESSILEWLYRNFGVTFMDFMGQILRDPRGRRDVLCFRRGNGRWIWDYPRLDLQWSARNPSIGCAIQSLGI